MLKELLPKLIHLKTPEPPQATNPGPNLLENVSTDSTSNYDDRIKRFSNSLYIKLSIILVDIVFLVVLGVNITLNQRIEGYQMGISSLVNSIEGFKDTNAKAAEVTRKIALYKKVTSEQQDISGKTTFLIAHLPNDVLLREYVFENGAYTLTLEMNSPIKMAQLIANYFLNKNVKEIVISAASLDAYQSKYTIVFRVSFVK
ncbi:MAG TPA: hypothetical protein VLI92_04225 [Candidatus Saccharimonadales bacterium]|nr:hypothetical protein [Candidatus Saccharimonadales bacterium]